MTRRLLVLTALFLVCSGYLAWAMRAEVVPLRQPLARLPFVIGEWNGRNTPRFSADVERVLGVDEYISRFYARDREPSVSLYVGYYQSQRQGDTIHSPLNCLPGAGWQPVSGDRLAIRIEATGRVIHVNRYVIEKGVERQVVLYWYQGHGRVVASEYVSKAYMVYDAIRTNRTDAALVRVTSPITAVEDERAAVTRVVSFVQSMYPLLGSHLPS
jgi:EpsI family protein